MRRTSDAFGRIAATWRHMPDPEEPGHVVDGLEPWPRRHFAAVVRGICELSTLHRGRAFLNVRTDADESRKHRHSRSWWRQAFAQISVRRQLSAGPPAEGGLVRGRYRAGFRKRRRCLDELEYLESVSRRRR